MVTSFWTTLNYIQSLCIIPRFDLQANIWSFGCLIITLLVISSSIKSGRSCLRLRALLQLHWEWVGIQLTHSICTLMRPLQMCDVLSLLIGCKCRTEPLHLPLHDNEVYLRHLSFNQLYTSQFALYF